MRKIIVLLFCLLLTGISARAQQITTAIVTVTNTAGTTNGMSFNLNGNVWVFTNAVNAPCSQAVNGTNIATTATNLWTALISCPQVNLNQTFNGSNGVTIYSFPGSALTATISGAWGTVTYVTNTVTQATVVRVPPAAVGNYEKTNVENGLAQYLGDNRGTNTVGTNAPMFSPWWTWINGLYTNLNSSITNFNGTNVQTGTIGTNSLSTQIYNLLFGGGPISSVFIPGLELQYESGTNSSGGALGTGFTNWVTTNQSLTLFGPVSSGNSHAAPFMNWSRNYDGAVLASMDAEGVWDFGIGNFSQLTVNNLPVGSGGGTNGGVSGAVGTLYNVSSSPTVPTSTYTITTVSFAGFYSTEIPCNGAYTADGSSPTYNVYYGGNNYILYGTYTNTTGGIFTYSPSGFVSGHWYVFINSISIANYVAQNSTFNFMASNFNSFWDFTPTVFTPTVPGSTIVTNYSAAITIAWGLGDNWNIALNGVTNLTASLAQDWEATNSQQVETHKIFLNSATNTCSLVFSQTNLWLWQNRQGVSDAAPTGLASNETMTITLHHRGTYTNWLATWDTTAAVGGGGTNGLTTTNWTALSGSYTTNTIYTDNIGAGIVFADFDIQGVNGSAGISAYFTNNGVGYQSAVACGGAGQTNDTHFQLSFPVNSGSTFQFILSGSGSPLSLNFFHAQFWQLPH